MRRVGGLFPQMLSWENFVSAAHKAARGKRDRAATQTFFANLEANLNDLIREVRQGRIHLGEFSRFIIHDPKRREICAPAFRERVLHHAVMNLCEPVFERRLIFDTYACRRGKGQQAAVTQAVRFARRNAFFLKCDIRRFFDSIDHAVLGGQLKRTFKDVDLLHLFERIVDSYCTRPGKGLPIGALTSQHFANSYLNPLDRFLKESRQVGDYVRYMDDFVVWGNSSAELNRLYEAIQGFLCDELKLRLKSVAIINRTPYGLGFLGYCVYPDGVQLSHRGKRRFATKVRLLGEARAAGVISEDELQRRLTSLVAFPRFARSWNYRRGVLHRITVEV